MNPGTFFKYHTHTHSQIDIDKRGSRDINYKLPSNQSLQNPVKKSYFHKTEMIENDLFQKIPCKK